MYCFFLYPHDSAWKTKEKTKSKWNQALVWVSSGMRSASINARTQFQLFVRQYWMDRCLCISPFCFVFTDIVAFTSSNVQVSSQLLINFHFLVIKTTLISAFIKSNRWLLFDFFNRRWTRRSSGMCVFFHSIYCQHWRKDYSCLALKYCSLFECCHGIIIIISDGLNTQCRTHVAYDSIWTQRIRLSKFDCSTTTKIIIFFFFISLFFFIFSLQIIRLSNTFRPTTYTMF